MANTKISDLTASAANLASTDLAPVVQTPGVGPVKMTGLQLAGGLLGSATFNGATVTTSQPVLNLSQTWNAAGVTFTGLQFNATDTASASGSLLLDLQVGGVSAFSATKGAAAQFSSANLRLGAADAAAPVAQTLQVQSVVAGTSNTAGANWTLKGSAGTGTGAGGSIIFQVAPAGSSGTVQNAYATALTIAGDRTITTTGVAVFGNSSAGQIDFIGTSGNCIASVTNSASTGQVDGFVARNTSVFGFSSSVNPLGTVDVRLYRDAANTLALRNGANAQTLRIYASADGSPGSNFQRLNLSCGTTANMAVVTASNGGTGAPCGLQFGAALTTGGGASNIFYIGNAGHIGWNTDNAYDIGIYTIGGTSFRPKDLYLAGRVYSGSTTSAVSNAITSTSGAIAVSAASSTLGLFESTNANSSGSGAGVLLYQNSGTAAASGTRLGVFLFGGISTNNGTVFRNSVAVQGFASENWSDTAYGGRIEFATTANTTTTRATRLIIGNSGVITFGATEANTVPALKPSSTTLQVRLGDDSAAATLEALSLKTGAPAGGTSGTWKLGVRVAATTTLDTTQYIEVDVGGTLYKLAVVTS